MRNKSDFFLYQYELVVINTFYSYNKLVYLGTIWNVVFSIHITGNLTKIKILDKPWNEGFLQNHVSDFVSKEMAHIFLQWYISGVIYFSLVVQNSLMQSFLYSHVKSTLTWIYLTILYGINHSHWNYGINRYLKHQTVLT